MRMGKPGGCDYHRPFFGFDFRVLIIEFSFATAFHIVQEIHKQKNSVQCFAVVLPGINFGMPMMVASPSLGIFL